jgi:hypothetical protein
VAGVDEKGAPKEDTLRETPAAKSDSRPSIPDDWKPPPRRKDALARPDEVEPGARLDFGFGGARVRTFQVKGPLAVVVALTLLAAIGVVFALVFVFAVGIGAALALGGAAFAALGMGAAGIRRLTSGRRSLERKDQAP